jgi:Zn-dependent protease with chaperone function/Tfp pilus assembly protein PilF
MIKPRNSFQMTIFLIVIFSFLLAACANEPAISPAPQPTRDPTLEQSIEQQLGGMNPEAVLVYREATTSLDSGELENAKDLYEQLIVMAPEFATAYRRLSYVESYMGDLERAEEMAGKALELEPNAFNQTAMARVLLQKDTPKDSQDAFSLASSAAESLPDDEETVMVLMMTAGAIQNLEAMRQADEHLLQIAASNPLAHYYAGLLAATDGKWEKAEKEILLSGQLGMPPESVQGVLSSGIARNALFFRLFRWSAIGMAFWLLGLGVLYSGGTVLSRATMRALNKAEPSVDTQVLPEEHRLRSIYRTVINVLSLYFYVSLPFIILALLLVVGGAFYIFFMIGTVPIQLAILLVIMLFVSLFAIAKSLFTRIKDIPPGQELARKDAPELWTLVEEVARKLNIRPVDKIYLTPFTGIAVYENGSILKKMRGAGQRNLILGMGALTGMTQGQLAAILAHEYGHFSNQDTAGGDLAYLVYASLNQIAKQLIQSGAARIYNPVWLFLMGYQRIYLRVTLGASRLQEVLADRYAAMAYGSQNFIEGLKSVIRQAIAFPLQADDEIRKSLTLKRSVSNLYDLPWRDGLQVELDKQFAEAMGRTTSQYDSHPAPQERISWIERLHVPYSPMQDNPQPALHLFPNQTVLQQEMTVELMKHVRVEQRPGG